jgi:DNA invertase Pin-like site-specific DNA recombinase
MEDYDMTKRVALYLRTSHSERTVENQRLDLEKVAGLSNWQIVEVYQDSGISGAKGRDKRPAYDRLLKDATARKFDVIAAWSLDRLGRSMADLVAFLGEVQALKLDLYLHKERIDTSTPYGKMIYHIAGAFAEFEREVIRERIFAGLRRARKQGTRSGRAIGRPKVAAKVEAAVRAARAKGDGIQRIARDLGVGVSVVQRVVGGAG